VTAGLSLGFTKPQPPESKNIGDEINAAFVVSRVIAKSERSGLWILMVTESVLLSVRMKS
jgi:hypothetical protein